MPKFSTISCYAALSCTSQEDVMTAYARMVAAIVQQKKYKKCDIKTLCQDFKAGYGFELTYHPMQTVVQKCIELGHFTHDKHTNELTPNYSVIDREGFMGIVKEKNDEYAALLNAFGSYLESTHGIHSSEDDLNDRVLAFIERFGIKATVDKKIIFKIKDDYLFADFLVHCEESGQSEILDYLNDYTIGLSLSQIFTYSERPEKYTSKDATVFLDTGILFRLFGIDSVDNSDSYKQYISSMQKMGMKVKVYDHTVNEMIGIVERSKYWIGNLDYDATKCSETTYYFVSNGWSVREVDEFSSSIRYRLQNDFNIAVDTSPYPKVEDIRTVFEADVKDLIIKTYKESGSTVDLAEIDFSIDQDAKSIFYTQHKNGTVVPHNLDDIKNIFITLNKSLARVGYFISRDMVAKGDKFIPVVMTDLEWGTLIWFNSPASIAQINRPRLVSAAYAAFRPSEEVTKKLNETLTLLVEDEKITPAQCYILKTNPIAQRLLAQKTMNDTAKFVDATPFEILKEMESEAFQAGSKSRQEEIENLERIKNEAEFKYSQSEQKRVISDCKHEVNSLKQEIDNLRRQSIELQPRLDQLREISADIDAYVKRKIKHVKWGFYLLSAVLLWASWKIYKNDVGLLSLITAAVSIFVGAITVWNNEKITLLSIIPKIEKMIRSRRNALLHFSPREYTEIQNKITKIGSEISEKEKELTEAQARLCFEQAKVDSISADLSLTTN